MTQAGYHFMPHTMLTASLAVSIDERRIANAHIFFANFFEKTVKEENYNSKKLYCGHRLQHLLHYGTIILHCRSF